MAAAPPPPPNPYVHPSAHRAASATVFPHPTPPHNNPNPPQQRRLINWCCFLKFTFITSLSIGYILFFVWLVEAERSLKFPFQVDSLTISNFNLSGSLLTANWDLQYTARNPNKRIRTLHYDQITAAIYYGSWSVADTTAPPFVVYKGNQTDQKAGFAAYGAYVEKWVFDGMNKERSQSGGIGFSLEMEVGVNFKNGAWGSDAGYFRIYCGDLFVAFASNNSSTGNLLGGPSLCKAK